MATFRYLAWPEVATGLHSPGYHRDYRQNGRPSSEASAARRACLSPSDQCRSANMSVSGHVGMRTVPGTAIIDAEPGISKTKPGRWKSNTTTIEAQMHRCMACGMIANYVWLPSWCAFASGHKQGARKRLAHRPCRGRGLHV